MKKIILILFFLLIQNISFVQEEGNSATIIFNDNTTIKGFGEIKKNKIYFKLTLDEKPDVWSYDIVKGIIFSGYGYSEKHEYIKPDKYSKPILMEVIEEGNVNLYRKNSLSFSPSFDANGGGSFNSTFHNNSVISGNTHYDVSTIFYVKKLNEEYATDIVFSFKARANRYFSDCEIIIKKLKDRTFNSENIPQMVTYYNNFCYEGEN